MQKTYTNFILISQVGNSGYGKTITNQLKHRNVEYCSDAEASRKVNTHLFRKLDNTTEDTYEVKFTDSSRLFRLSICQVTHVTILL